MILSLFPEKLYKVHLPRLSQELSQWLCVHHSLPAIVGWGGGGLSLTCHLPAGLGRGPQVGL